MITAPRPDLDLLLGEIAVGGQRPCNQDDRGWTWGEALPAQLRSAGGVLRASDTNLRAIDGCTASITAQFGSARLLTAPSGPTTLYASERRGLQVWSTHAVAAAILATGAPELDPTVVPELLAFDFVGGDRTLLRDVRAVAPGTVVDFTATKVTERSYWPPRERWAPVSENEAYEHAASSLLETLERRLTALPDAQVALTGGLDSRVLVVAMRELGLSPKAFTWGDPSWPDVQGACHVAATLGLTHRVLPPLWLSSSEALADLDRRARWTDGVCGLAPVERTWPADPRTGVLGGMGGETGRSFYYRPPRSDRKLLAQLRLEARLPGATREASEVLRARVKSWLATAEETSDPDSWRPLDVLYAEQRVTRWGRSQLPWREGPMVGAFTPVEVARGLTSLPLAERLSDGFHRRFINSRAPELAPALPVPPRRSSARRAMRRLRRPPSRDPLVASLWAERPEARAWVTDYVLEHPLIRDALGDDWVRGTRRGFVGGEPRAAQQALLAAGPVSLSDALLRLRQSGT